MLKQLVKWSVISLAGIAALGMLVSVTINSSSVGSVNKRNASVALYGDRIGGSGAFIRVSDRSYILTNKHVCKGAIDGTYMKVLTNGGDEFFSKVIRVDADHDLCLLEGSDKYPYVTLGETLTQGENLKTFGHPRLQPLTVTDAQFIGETMISLITAVNTTQEKCPGKLLVLPPFLAMLTGLENVCVERFVSNQIHGYSQPGSSGSPVLNSDHKLVGVIFAGDNGDAMRSFMVPLKNIKAFLAK